jgi:hypothetical protein
MRYLIALSAILFIGCDNAKNEFQITDLKEEITHLGTEEINVVKPLAYESDCTNLVPNSFWDAAKNNPTSILDSIGWEQIENVGAKVWTLLQDSAPVLSAKSMYASALPNGINCWTQLSNWSRPRAETYQVTYKNLYGVNVIDIKFRVMYSYGGRFKDKGRYLMNSTIQFTSVDVMTGFTLDANVDIPRVINISSDDNPVAGMQMTLNWNMDTKPISFKKQMRAVSFFITGDGSPTQLIP